MLLKRACCWVALGIFANVVVQDARAGVFLESLNPLDVDLNFRSTSSTLASKIQFANRTQYPVDIYWINGFGDRVWYQTIQPWSKHLQSTYVGHPWLVVRSGTGGTTVQLTGLMLGAFAAQTTIPSHIDDFDTANINPAVPPGYPGVLAGPESFDVGSQVMGATGFRGPTLLRVGNAGGAPVYTTGVLTSDSAFNLSNFFSYTTCRNTVLYPGDSCDVQLLFIPKKTGLNVGTITINTLTLGAGLAVPVYGHGIVNNDVQTAPVVEYFHAQFGHYFITNNTAEIAGLDSGQIAGWSRTGQQFGAYDRVGVGYSDVCRFFTVAFAPKSSHFYTPSDTECQGVKLNPHWQFEGTRFSVPVPNAAAQCPIGTRQVHRLYNDGKGGAPNHRYVADAGVQSQMIAAGWVPEGVAFCSPDAIVGQGQLIASKRNVAPLEPVTITVSSGPADANYALALDLGYGYVTNVPFAPGAKTVSFLAPPGRIDANGEFAQGVVSVRLLIGSSNPVDTGISTSLEVGAFPSSALAPGVATLGVLTALDRLLADAHSRYLALPLSGYPQSSRDAMLLKITAYRTSLATLRQQLVATLAGATTVLGPGVNGRTAFLSPADIARLDRLAVGLANSFGSTGKRLVEDAWQFGASAEDPIAAFATDFISRMRETASAYRAQNERLMNVVSLACGIGAIAVGITTAPGIALAGLAALTFFSTTAHGIAMSTVLDVGPTAILTGGSTFSDFQGTVNFATGRAGDQITSQFMGDVLGEIHDAAGTVFDAAQSMMSLVEDFATSNPTGGDNSCVVGTAIYEVCPY